MEGGSLARETMWSSVLLDSAQRRRTLPGATKKATRPPRPVEHLNSCPAARGTPRLCPPSSLAIRVFIPSVKKLCWRIAFVV